MWTVGFSAKAARQVPKLPERIRERFMALVRSLQVSGPGQPAMPHFGKLKNQGETYHCHLNKGRPVYVAVWRVNGNQIKFMEVTYVGTHEKAPY